MTLHLGAIVERIPPTTRPETFAPARGIVVYHDGKGVSPYPVNERATVIRISAGSHMVTGEHGSEQWRIIPPELARPAERVRAALIAWEPPSPDPGDPLPYYETPEWQALAAMLPPRLLNEILEGDWPDFDELAVIVAETVVVAEAKRPW